MIYFDLGGWSEGSDQFACGYLITGDPDYNRIRTIPLQWTDRFHDCMHVRCKFSGPSASFNGSCSIFNPHYGYWFTIPHLILDTDFSSYAKERGWDHPGYWKGDGNVFYTWNGEGWSIKYTILNVSTESMWITAYDHQYDENVLIPLMYIYADTPSEPFDASSINCCMPREVSDGELFAQAVDNISGLETNMIANVIGVKEFAKTASLKLNDMCNILEIGDIFECGKMLGLPSKQVLRNPKQIKKFVWKAASNKWLQYRYALCTTLSDLDELRHKTDSALINIRDISSNRIPPRRLGASVTRNGVTYSLVGTYECNFHNEVQKLWYNLEQLGLQPNLQNIWDIVPYSFVVDWFLPIGEYFSHIDRAFMFGNKSLSNTVYSCPYRFYDFFVSTKQTLPIDLGNGIHCKGDIYHRRCLDAVPSLVYYSDSYEPSLKTWIKRVVDGSALFIHF